MSKKDEAITSLEKLDELTKDILTNNTDGGDPNRRQIIFSGLTQTKNSILLDKMKELLFVETEEDLKKTIILGIFIHKEMFEPVIEYAEQTINMPYIDESYDNKESLLFILDALIELAYKNKINDFETAIPLFLQIFKISCSEKSSSTLADKLLQRILNSKIGAIKVLQDELAELIQDDMSEINSKVIAIDILARGQYSKIFDIIENILNKVTNKNILQMLPIIDVATIALNYNQDKKNIAKIQRIISSIQNLNVNTLQEQTETTNRIEKRIKNFKF